MLHRSVDKEHWTESMKDTWQSTNLDTQNIANFINSKQRISHVSVLISEEKIMHLNFFDLSYHILEKIV